MFFPEIKKGIVACLCNSLLLGPVNTGNHGYNAIALCVFETLCRKEFAVQFCATGLPSYQ